MEHYDVVIAVGAELNQWTTHFGQALKGRRLVQVDIDTAAFGRFHRPDVALLGDATATVRALTDRIRAHQESSREPSAELTSILEHPAPVDNSPYLDTDSSVDPRHALADIDRLLPPDRKVVIDGGHAAMIACRSLRASSPRNWTCTSYGDFSAIGQGLSVAIGACFAHPGERITHVTADGSLMMGLAELDTARRYSLPLTIVVLNDHSMGDERHLLGHKGTSTKYADYPSPDFVALAGAYGARGYRIDNADQLKQLPAALNHDSGMVVIDIHINGDYVDPVFRDITHYLESAAT